MVVKLVVIKIVGYAVFMHAILVEIYVYLIFHTLDVYGVSNVITVVSLFYEEFYVLGKLVQKSLH